jgi:tryptophanyl-tRNA synthetase
MGKSEGEGNALFLNDEPEVMRKKVMRAVSDSGPTMPNEPKPEAIQNLFTLLSVVSQPDTLLHYEEAYNSCNIRYGDMKKQLAEDIIAFTAPMRERIKEINADTDYLRKVVKQGAEKARVSGSKTMADVREMVGIKSF